MDGRPNWTDFFFGAAFSASRRSADQRTKHGCVIVTPDNRILGTGYNSFPSDVDDESMPQDSTLKHLLIIHSEINAVTNCLVHPKLYPGKLRAYITGEPCIRCMIHLREHGIRELHCAKRKGFSTPRPDEDAAKSLFLPQAKLQIFYHKPKLDWMYDEEMRREFEELGFVRA